MPRRAVSRSDANQSARELFAKIQDDLLLIGEVKTSTHYALEMYGPFNDDTAAYLGRERVRRWMSRHRQNILTWAEQHVDPGKLATAIDSINGKKRQTHVSGVTLSSRPDDEEQAAPKEILDEINASAEEDDGVELEAFLDHLAERKNFEENEFPTEDRLDIFIKSDKPVPIVFSSDWHLGSIGVDYEHFKADYGFILAHPEVKIITVGDLIDNFVRFKSAEAILQQVCNPRMQHKLLFKIATRLAKTKQLLAATWGNHDVERDEHILGQSMLAQTLAAATHFFDGRGLIVLKVGPTIEEAMTYTILLTHTPPGKSMYDKNYGGKRLYREHFPADVIVTAHFHSPAIQQDDHYGVAREAGFNFGGPRITIACGTYKTKDAYSRRYWSEGKVGAPTVLFWHNQQRMAAFKSAEDAVIYTKGLDECRSSTQSQCGSKPSDDDKQPTNSGSASTNAKQEKPSRKQKPLKRVARKKGTR